MNAQEFKAIYMHEYGEVYAPDGAESVEEVCTGDEVVDHKMVYQSSVYRVGEQYFEVQNSWSNSGYWSDGETYPAEVYEVKPVKKVVEITEWVAI